MILVQNLSKIYGTHTLFENLSFSLNQRERIGLIGRNGYGKTTLFRIISGEEESNNGQINFQKGYKIGYLSQQLDFQYTTVLEEAICGLPEERKDEEWKVKKILSGLGFNEEDYNKPITKYSGGYQMRINLAKVLASEPNLLLLDEPTNFLDIISIRWIEHFLNNWPNEFMVISHDRGFLDKICTSIMGITRKKVKKIEGNTQKYFDQITMEENNHEKMRLNSERKRKQTETFISKFRAKARQASLAQSRMKALKKQEVFNQLEKITNLDFSFNEASFKAKTVMDINNLKFSYSDKEPYLIENLNFTISASDTICIIGKNGKGKTTLLKLLAEELTPTEGFIRKSPQIKTAYFEQTHTADLNENSSIEDEIMLNMESNNNKKARDIAASMMFSGDNALKKIKILSGGEKCRVLLGKLIAKPANTLLLDEPTRHLDLESTEALVEAIKAFNGATILITHNESIIARLATKLIVFQKNKVFFFEGNYQELLDKYDLDETEINNDKAQKELQKKQIQKLSKKSRAEFIKNRSAALTPIKRQIKMIETQIEDLEELLAKENSNMIQASIDQNSGKIKELSIIIPKRKEDIDKLYNDLETYTDTLEEVKKEFKE